MLTIKFSDLNYIRHIKPSLAMFLASISISLYLQIDTFVRTTEWEINTLHYAAANKLSTTCISNNYDG